MNKKKQPSLQDIIKQRKEKEFVGRAEFLDLFQENLALSWDNAHRMFLFNISGQGGVGKSTLLMRFQQLAKGAGAVTIQTNETEIDVPMVMAHFSDQLKSQGYKVGKFDERYKIYRQKRKELEVDADAPQGFTGFAAKTLTKVGVNLARQIPIGGTVFSLIDEDKLAIQVGEWAEYVRHKLTNKDEVHLILEPEEVLTPLFLEELRAIADERLICLFFDTYERTEIFLDPWLRSILDGNYGDVPANLIIVIAGRDPLNHNLWLPYEGLAVRISLEQFSEKEVREYLAQKGISDERVIEVILELSGRLPLLVAMLAAEQPSDPDIIDDPSSTAVDRFLKWVSDPRRRQFALNAALPRFLNRDPLAILVASEEVDDLFNWLKGMPFVQERGGGWIYHEVVRGQMLRYKRRESPQSWRETHEKLSTYYENLRDNLRLEANVMRLDLTWQVYELEFRYHKLCQAPQENLPPAINRFLNALNAKLDFGQRWATTLQQAGVDVDSFDVKKWGTLLVNGLRAHNEKQYENAVEMFTSLLQYPKLEAHPQAVALRWRGESYRAMRLYEKAVADFEKAAELKPEDQRIYYERGWVYMLMDRYEEALANFDKSIELDSKFVNALIDRGQALRALKRYKEALTSINKAIEVEPRNDQAFHIRGYIYLDLKQFRDALSDLDRSIELNDSRAIVFEHRGEVYLEMGQHEQAQKDFTKAFELEPDNVPSSLVRRGWKYFTLDQHELAIADFNKVLQADPSNLYALGNLGQVYRAMKKYKDALHALNTAIAIHPSSDWLYHNRGVTYLYAEQYEKALDDLNHAVKLNSSSSIAFTHRGAAYLKLNRFDESLVDLNQALTIDPNNTYALSYRQQLHKIFGNYEQSITDITRMIELEPSSWYFYERGLAYQILEETNAAKADFNVAIQTVEQELKAEDKYWRNHFNLALYHLANEDFVEADKMYKKVEAGQIPSDAIQMAIEDLEDYLKLFPLHSQARSALDYLRCYKG